MTEQQEQAVRELKESLIGHQAREYYHRALVVAGMLSQTQSALEQERKQHEIDNKGNEDWINSLCEQLCKMEDALGFKNDCYDKEGKWVPTIGPWLERVRDLLAAEGEVGDLKEALGQSQISANCSRLAYENEHSIVDSLTEDLEQAQRERDEAIAEIEVQRSARTGLHEINIRLRSECDELRTALQDAVNLFDEADKAPDSKSTICTAERREAWAKALTIRGKHSISLIENQRDELQAKCAQMLFLVQTLKSVEKSEPSDPIEAVREIVKDAKARCAKLEATVTECARDSQQMIAQVQVSSKAAGIYKQKAEKLEACCAAMRFQLFEVSKACADIIGWDEIDADAINKVLNDNDDCGTGWHSPEEWAAMEAKLVIVQKSEAFHIEACGAHQAHIDELEAKLFASEAAGAAYRTRLGECGWKPCGCPGHWKAHAINCPIGSILSMQACGTAFLAERERHVKALDRIANYPHREATTGTIPNEQQIAREALKETK